MAESQRVGEGLNSVLFLIFRDRIRTQRALNAYVAMEVSIFRI